MSRRTRSQRAGFWAKVVSFVLMIMVAATLRSEPELRQAFVAAGTDTVLKVTGRTSAPAATAPTPVQMPSAAMLDALTQQIERGTGVGKIEPFVKPPDPNRIKVNRFGQEGGSGIRFKSVAPRDTSNDMATTRTPAPSPQTGQLQGTGAQDGQTAQAAEALGRLLQNFNVGN